MSNDQLAASPFRLTIRSLFLWTTIVALSFGALLFANKWWLAALSLLVGLAATWAAIVVVVERGARRAFAVGVLAWILMQAFVLPELLGTGSRLPSSRLMGAIYPLVAGPELLITATRSSCVSGRSPGRGSSSSISFRWGICCLRCC